MFPLAVIVVKWRLYITRNDVNNVIHHGGELWWVEVTKPRFIEENKMLSFLLLLWACL